MEKLKVTSLEELKQVKQTVIVNLGNFEDGTEFVAELKKPDIMNLIVANKIPNTLLDEAMKIFNGKATETMQKVSFDNDATALKQLGATLEMLTDECLVNPSYQDLKNIGIDLTLDMKMNILVFAQNGLEGLKSFREKQASNENNKSSE